MTIRSSSFGGGEGPVVSLVNRASFGGGNTTASLNSADALNASNAAGVLSGANTANTLVTVLSVTGRGCVKFLAAYANDSTSRTLRLKVTIDGVAVFDATSSAIAQSGRGLVAIGSINAGTAPGTAALDRVPFGSSLLVQVATSLTETDKIIAMWNYEVWA